MADINKEKKEVDCWLEEPSIKYKDSFLIGLKEYTGEGRILDEGIADPGNDFAGFLQDLKNESLGINMKPGRVPQTTYWIVDKDGYAGRISIRHTLNEQLKKDGGHIGYGLIPSKRGRGYGTKALELILPKAQALGFDKVLLTCDVTNIASKKVIEANGGVFENEIPNTEAGKPNRFRYWINLLK